MTRVKICGITNLQDALQAVDCGADALGFVFYVKSPRAVDAGQVCEIVSALPAFVTTVGLFVNETPQTIRDIAAICRLDRVQLHGDETPEDCRQLADLRVIKALRVRDAHSLAAADAYPVDLLLDAWSDDAYGGTGERFDWALARKVTARRPVILAGGLTPANVATAVETLCPYAVDVSSGVEGAPGKKDHTKMADFIRQVRNR